MSKKMRKKTKMIAALFISLAQFSIAAPKTVSAEELPAVEAVTLYGGWFEEAYAEWDSSVIGGSVTVSYAEKGSPDFVSVDPEATRFPAHSLLCSNRAKPHLAY